MKCFNPDCLNQNPQQTNFCQKCGQKLLLRDRYRGISIWEKVVLVVLFVVLILIKEIVIV
jgi:hypothetical protein